MDNMYVMVGIILETDGTMEDINRKLSRYNLVADSDNHDFPSSVRRATDDAFFRRYSIIDPIRHAGEFVVGRVLGYVDYENVIGEITDEDEDEAKRAVREDIPEAKKLYFLSDALED